MGFIMTPIRAAPGSVPVGSVGRFGRSLRSVGSLVPGRLGRSLVPGRLGRSLRSVAPPRSVRSVAPPRSVRSPGRLGRPVGSVARPVAPPLGPRTEEGSGPGAPPPARSRRGARGEAPSLRGGGLLVVQEALASQRRHPRRAPQHLPSRSGRSGPWGQTHPLDILRLRALCFIPLLITYLFIHLLLLPI